MYCHAVFKCIECGALRCIASCSALWSIVSCSILWCIVMQCTSVYLNAVWCSLLKCSVLQCIEMQCTPALMWTYKWCTKVQWNLLWQRRHIVYWRLNMYLCSVLACYVIFNTFSCFSIFLFSVSVLHTRLQRCIMYGTLDGGCRIEDGNQMVLFGKYSQWRLESQRAN